MEINIPKYRFKQSFSKTNIYHVIKEQESQSKPILNKLMQVDVESRTTSLIFFERDTTDEIYLYQGDIDAGTVIDDKFNEELDTATINLVHSKKDDFLSYLLPTNTKVLYIPQVDLNKVIVTDGENVDIDFSELFQFDSDNKPTNHKQYIICGGSINCGKNIIRHQYGLVEPTAILRLGHTGTNSHTNMPRAVIYRTDGTPEKYRQLETNLFSIIERQFKITGLKSIKEDRTWFRHFNIKAEYLRNSGIGISESFNNATLYDSMFKLGKYIKCYPVVYFNCNYDPDDLNEKEFNLFFESYELRNRKKISLNDIKHIDTDWAIANSTGRFTNHVVCEAENIIPTQEMIYPNEEEYVGLTGDIGEITFAEPGKNQPLPYYFRTFKKIQKVDEVIMIIANGNAVGVIQNYHMPRPFKKTYDAIEYNDWILLSTTAREKTAYYYIGDDKVYVGHLEEIKREHSGQDLNIYIGKIKYKPLINSKIESGSGDYIDIYNQLDSNLDMNVLGNFIQEYAKSQVNYDVPLQTVFDKYSDIPESGTIIENDGEQLIIVSRKILVNKTSFYVSFVLNYYEPKRSELINASKKITKTFVDSSKAFERLVNFKETYLIDVTTDESIIKNETPTYFKDYRSIVPFFNDDEYKQNSIAVAFKFFHVNKDFQLRKNFKLSMSNSISGTSIIYHFATQTSKIFGIFGGFIQLNSETDYNKNQVADYTDVFGKLKSIDLIFSSSKEYENSQSMDASFEEMLQKYDEIDSSPSYSAENEGEKTKDKYNLVLSWGKEIKKILNSYYSITDVEFNDLKSTAIFELNELEILKDTNETLNFTYQIEFLPKNNNKLMIFNNFARFCNFINHEDTSLGVNIYIAEVTNGFEFDATTEKIDSLNFIRIEFRMSDNSILLLMPNIKMEASKQYVLCKKYDEEYYPLLLVFNTESKDFVYMGELKYSNLILYIEKNNI